ncbi:uncharacterized protein LOC114279450 [Camellia sinensis]|uniref:uncharacterized protein LOC114279450 n=1 Tax=Camellia sinensis TaxID=4442 RepID=UPI00103567A1|nr:uncharacterized protein LOC114279450 [Camellia sinensis]
MLGLNQNRYTIASMSEEVLYVTYVHSIKALATYKGVILSCHEVMEDSCTSEDKIFRMFSAIIPGGFGLILSIGGVSSGSIQELLVWWFGQKRQHLGRVIWEALPLAILWTIWIARNDKVFNSKEPNWVDLVENIKINVAFWVSSFPVMKLWKTVAPEESTVHLLVHYYYSWRIWSDIVNWWGILWVSSGSIQEMLVWWFGQKRQHLGRVIWEALPLAILWTIWIARNDKVFNSKEPNWVDLVENIKINVAFWVKQSFNLLEF